MRHAGALSTEDDFIGQAGHLVRLAVNWLRLATCWAISWKDSIQWR
jgi:hypothetical protein